MLKILSKFAPAALALSVGLSLASMPADARPSSSSFKGGFSSQRSSSSSSKGGFGAFGSRSAPAAAPRKSDSALSRKLDRESSEANALRTLDQRRQAQAARETGAAPRPAPGYEQRDMRDMRDARTPPAQDYGRGYGNAPAPAQAPVIVNQNGGIGLGHVVAGAILARSMSNAHANNNAGNGNNNSSGNGGYYPAPGGSAGDLANQAGANSVGASTGSVAAAPVPAPAAPAAKDSGGSVLGAILWLGVLALAGWGTVRLWKRAKARRAANKPNYSFERN